MSQCDVKPDVNLPRMTIKHITYKYYSAVKFRAMKRIASVSIANAALSLLEETTMLNRYLLERATSVRFCSQ